jgi:hypothetical protein
LECQQREGKEEGRNDDRLFASESVSVHPAVHKWNPARSIVIEEGGARRAAWEDGRVRENDDEIDMMATGAGGHQG